MHPVVRNLRRATTFRRFRKTGSLPRLGQDPPRLRTRIRAGSKQWDRRKRSGWLRETLELSWPGPALLFCLVAAHLNSFGGTRGLGMFALFGLSASTVAMVRAFTANAGEGPRVTGVLICAIPVVILLAVVLS